MRATLTSGNPVGIAIDSVGNAYLADQNLLDPLVPSRPVSFGSAANLAGLRAWTGRVSVRTGFDLSQPPRVISAAAAADETIAIEELGRVELTFGGPVDAGYLSAAGELRDLPAGSHLDPAAGVFTWAPAPGFFGRYTLEFLRAGARVTVDVIVGAAAADHIQGSSAVGP